MVAKSPLALLLLLLLAIGWFTGRLVAQTPHAVFEPAVSYPSAAPEDVAVGDVDGDGHVDLLVAQRLGFGPTRILRGLGDGTFEVAGLVPGSLAVNDHALVDLGGDGDPELIENVGAQLRVRRALAGFAFDTPVVLIDGVNRAWPEPVDLDADGDLDLVVGEAGPTTIPVPGVYTFLNDGGGAFSAGPVLPVTDGARWVAVGDIDHAGPVDLVYATLGDAALWFAPGLGGGAFDTPVLVTPLTEPITLSVRHEHHALADLDGDGELDLLWMETLDDSLQFLKGHGDGTFAGAVVSDLPTINSGLASLAVGDLTRDGVPDALVNDQIFDHLYVLAGDGAGGFAMSLDVDDLVGALQPTPADLDEDGVLDVALVTGQETTVPVLLNHTYGPGSPFVDLGAPLGGPDGGRPILLADGAPVYGEPIAFRLAEGRPLATSGLVLGLSRLDASFKGGVMVPYPDVVQGPVPLDAEGRCSFAGPWLAAVGGWDFWAQWWIVDPIGPKGYTASTTVQTSVP